MADPLVERMKADRGWLARAMSKVPGFRGYLENTTVWEADRLVRQEISRRLGELKAGMLADITLIRQDGLHMTPRANPLAALIYCARATDVDTVLCDGKVLMRGRKLLTIDKEAVRREVQARLSRLSQRVPNARIAFYPTL